MHVGSGRSACVMCLREVAAVCVHVREAAGLLSIGLALVASYGVGSYCGLIFSPLMSILPFILPGIGVVRMPLAERARYVEIAMALRNCIAHVQGFNVARSA
jgi:hypothetical protein